MASEFVPRAGSPFKFARAEDCPDVKGHTKHPDGYLAFAGWADSMASTHVQERCPTCGFWSIWRPKVKNGE